MCQKRLPSQEVEELSQALMDRAALRDVKRAAAYYKFIRYSYRAGGRSLRRTGYRNLCVLITIKQNLCQI